MAAQFHPIPSEGRDLYITGRVLYVCKIFPIEVVNEHFRITYMNTSDRREAYEWCPLDRG